MSQKKVDKYKKEKKNRAKIMKRKKITKVIVIFVVALGAGSIIGLTAGKKYYNYIREKELENRTVSAAYFDDWFETYYAEAYSGFVSFEDDTATSTDADSATATDAE